MSQLAYEDAVRHYASALPLVDDPTARCRLLLALGDAHDRAGATQASRTAYREAADIAQRSALPELLAWAAVGYGGRILWEIGRDDERLPLLEHALAALPARRQSAAGAAARAAGNEAARHARRDRADPRSPGRR